MHKLHKTKPDGTIKACGFRLDVYKDGESVHLFLDGKDIQARIFCSENAHLYWISVIHGSSPELMEVNGFAIAEAQSEEIDGYCGALEERVRLNKELRIPCSDNNNNKRRL